MAAAQSGPIPSTPDIKMSIPTVWLISSRKGEHCIFTVFFLTASSLVCISSELLVFVITPLMNGVQNRRYVKKAFMVRLLANARTHHERLRVK